MRIIAPRTGANEIPVGSEQLEYREYTAAVHAYVDGRAVIVIRFRLSEEEKQRIADGEDLYLAVLTGGLPIHPIEQFVGQTELNRAYPPVST